MIKYYICSDCGVKFKKNEHYRNHIKFLHNKWVEDETTVFEFGQDLQQELPSPQEAQDNSLVSLYFQI